MIRALGLSLCLAAAFPATAAEAQDKTKFLEEIGHLLGGSDQCGIAINGARVNAFLTAQNANPVSIAAFERAAIVSAQISRKPDSAFCQALRKAAAENGIID